MSDEVSWDLLSPALAFAMFPDHDKDAKWRDSMIAMAIASFVTTQQSARQHIRQWHQRECPPSGHERERRRNGDESRNRESGLHTERSAPVVGGHDVSAPDANPYPKHCS